MSEYAYLRDLGVLHEIVAGAIRVADASAVTPEWNARKIVNRLKSAKRLSWRLCGFG